MTDTIIFPFPFPLLHIWNYFVWKATNFKTQVEWSGVWRIEMWCLFVAELGVLSESAKKKCEAGFCLCCISNPVTHTERKFDFTLLFFWLGWLCIFQNVKKMTLVFVYCYDMSKRVSGSGGKTLDTLGNFHYWITPFCDFHFFPCISLTTSSFGEKQLSFNIYTLTRAPWLNSLG